jgi:hypothetical protein
MQQDFPWVKGWNGAIGWGHMVSTDLAHCEWRPHSKDYALCTENTACFVRREGGVYLHWLHRCLRSREVARSAVWGPCRRVSVHMRAVVMVMQPILACAIGQVLLWECHSGRWCAPCGISCVFHRRWTLHRSVAPWSAEEQVLDGVYSGVWRSAVVAWYKKYEYYVPPALREQMTVCRCTSTARRRTSPIHISLIGRSPSLLCGLRKACSHMMSHLRCATMTCGTAVCSVTCCNGHNSPASHNISTGS